MATAARSRSSFRVGRVKGYLRGKVWYLCYQEGGRRRRPRVGEDVGQAKLLAAQTNAQLHSGVATAPSFEPVTVAELRTRWLDYHEHVRRSSVPTVNRYRTATDHLLNFVGRGRASGQAGNFAVTQAEAFVRYLREVEVAPNGHRNTAKRRLRDKGIRFVLETCRSLFVFAAKRRHLPPYAENPFAALEIGRIPVEDAKPIVLLTPVQERAFLEACDDWQLPLFLTLIMTGLRPGELAHLLLPEDLDLSAGVLRVRNKAKLGWQVKTRGEREVPLHPRLVEVLARHIGTRRAGAAFRQRRCDDGHRPPLVHYTVIELELEQERRVLARQVELGRPLARAERLQLAKTVWRDLSSVNEDYIRLEFMRLARAIGLPHLTMPKILRHGFATCLQDGDVDPLIRSQLMGHAPGDGRAGGGLGMTAVYTHSRPGTVRRQLEAALACKPWDAIAQWMKRGSDFSGARRSSRSISAIPNPPS